MSRVIQRTDEVASFCDVDMEVIVMGSVKLWGQNNIENPSLMHLLSNRIQKGCLRCSEVVDSPMLPMVIHIVDRTV